MESLISILAGLVVGAVGGYTLFRYVLKKTYNRILDEANRESEVIKEKKLLEVKEKFLNKKAELEKQLIHIRFLLLDISRFLFLLLKTYFYFQKINLFLFSIKK